MEDEFGGFGFVSFGDMIPMVVTDQMREGDWRNASKIASNCEFCMDVIIRMTIFIFIKVVI